MIAPTSTAAALWTQDPYAFCEDVLPDGAFIRNADVHEGQIMWNTSFGDEGEIIICEAEIDGYLQLGFYTMDSDRVVQLREEYTPYEAQPYYYPINYL